MDASLSRRRPALLFLAAAGLVVAVEAVVVQIASVRAHPDLLGGAVAFDLVVLVPALWGWMVVRSGRAPAVSLVPVAVAGWLVAKTLLPSGAESGLRVAAELVPLLEVGVLLYVAVRCRRVARSYRSSDAVDPVLRMREALTSVLGARTPARLVADEVSMFRYLVRPPGGEPGPAARTFSYHRRSGWGGVVFALSLAVAVEAVAVHVLVAQWSAPVAWGLTALSLYGLVWLVADWRATRARPILLERNRLLVRTGLRWTASVPLDAVAGVRRARPGERLDGDDELSTAVLAPPGLVVSLVRPVAVEGPYGLEKKVVRLGLAPDDPDALAAALEAAAEL